MFNSNLVPMKPRVCIAIQNMSWPWNRGQGSLKIIENGTTGYPVYAFILVFNSNYGLSLTVSKLWRDICRKSQNFQTPPLVKPPWEYNHCKFCNGLQVTENQKDGAIIRSKKIYDTFSRFDTIAECDRQTDRHSMMAITRWTQERRVQKLHIWQWWLLNSPKVR